MTTICPNKSYFNHNKCWIFAFILLVINCVLVLSIIICLIKIKDDVDDFQDFCVESIEYMKEEGISKIPELEKALKLIISKLS